MNELVRPAPLPEELDYGYLGRVLRFNGITTESDAFERIERMLGFEKTARRERPSIELLSLIAGQSLEQFAQQHSMIPLNRAITTSYPGVPHGSSTLRFILFKRGIGTERQGAHFCAKCASDDVGFHGVSYWRRDHQIPGQLWCPKHLMPLHYIRKAHAFLKPPSTLLTDADMIEESRVEAVKKHSLANRALDIASGLMARPAPIDSSKASALLRKKAVEKGHRAQRGESGFPKLVDQICDSFPGHWLDDLFPGGVSNESSKAKNLGEPREFPRASAPSVWSYILASAVLFESADEALNKLVSFADGVEAPIRAASMQQLISEYKDRELSRTTAEHCKTKNLRDALEAFYLHGRSVTDSAAIGRLSSFEMEALIRKVGGHLKSALIEAAEPIRTSDGGVERSSTTRLGYQ